MCVVCGDQQSHEHQRPCALLELRCCCCYVNAWDPESPMKLAAAQLTTGSKRSLESKRMRRAAWLGLSHRQRRLMLGSINIKSSNYRYMCMFNERSLAADSGLKERGKKSVVDVNNLEARAPKQEDRISGIEAKEEIGFLRGSGMKVGSWGGADSLQSGTASCSSSANYSCSSACCFTHGDGSYIRRPEELRASSNNGSLTILSGCSSSCESTKGVQQRVKVETRCCLEATAAATERTMQVLPTTAAPDCRNGCAPVARVLAGDAALAQQPTAGGLSIDRRGSEQGAGAAVVSAASSTPRNFFIRLCSSSMRSGSKEKSSRSGGFASRKRIGQGNCSAAHKVQRKPAGSAAKATGAASAADFEDDPAAAAAAAEEEKKLLAKAALAEAARPLPRRLVARCISHENHEPWRASVSYAVR
ncbi:hypothetical protein Emag_006622 [Eimeria magna]